MHTLEVEDTRFHYNPDLSGSVTILHGDQGIEVPGSDLLAFVAEAIRRQRMEQLEEASRHTILFGHGRGAHELP